MFSSVATEPGSADTPNEDWVAVSPAVAVVLDGVTVFSDTVTGCQHGTPWYVRQLGTRLLAAAADPAVPLAAALARPIREVAALHEDVCDLSHVGAPSAAVAVARFGEQLADYLVLADVTILFDHASGLSVVTDKRVASTVADLEGQRDIGPQIMERREQYRNQEGGYWVAAADPDVAEHAITGSAPLSELRHTVVMTDGATRLVTPFERDDWNSLLNLSISNGAKAAIERVRRTERDDPEGNRWPRFKISDDAAIAVIGIDPTYGLTIESQRRAQLLLAADQPGGLQLRLAHTAAS